MAQAGRERRMAEVKRLRTAGIPIRNRGLGGGKSGKKRSRGGD